MIDICYYSIFIIYYFNMINKYAVIGVLFIGMIMLFGLLGYGMYDVHQSRIVERDHQWQQEQEKKDLVAKCANESVDKSVEAGKKLRDTIQNLDTKGGGNETFDQLLSNVYGPIAFPTSYKEDDGYSYQTYQNNYTICMQSHGLDIAI